MIHHRVRPSLEIHHPWKHGTEVFPESFLLNRTMLGATTPLIFQVRS